jgi:hypothetical protein
MTRTRRIARWFWPPRGDRYEGERTFKFNYHGFLIRAGLYLAIGFVAWGIWFNATLAGMDRDERGIPNVDGAAWCKWYSATHCEP